MIAVEPLGQTLIKNTDQDILKECCWALNDIIDESKDHIQAFMNGPLLTRLIDLVNHESLSI